MDKMKKITICTGVGLNMFFPEYITIGISKGNYKLFEETGLLEENLNKVNIAELMECEAMQLLRGKLEEEPNENTK